MSLMVQTHLILHEDLLELRLFQDVPATSFLAYPSCRSCIKVGCPQNLISSKKVLFHLRLETWVSHFLFGVITSFALSRAWVSGAPKCTSSSKSATSVSPFSRFHPRAKHIRGMFQGALSFQIDGFLTGLLATKLGDIQSLNQTELPVLSMIHQTAVHQVFSRPIRGLEDF